MLLTYFWAPLIDRIQIPFLTKKLVIESLGFFNTDNNFNWVNILELYKSSAKSKSSYWCRINFALASATQDITVDALRIEQIKKEEKEAMAAGAAVAVVGWWSGYKLGSVIALTLADF